MSTTGNSLEIIRFKVAPENAENFLAARAHVDKEVKLIDGFLASELCRLDETNWIMLIRWQSAIQTSAAQKITATLPSINEWIAIAEQFVSFETATVVYSSVDE